MPDAAELFRRQRIVEINAQPASREALEAQYGQVWDTDQLSQDFEAVGLLGHEKLQTTGRYPQRSPELLKERRND